MKEGSGHANTEKQTRASGHVVTTGGSTASEWKESPQACKEAGIHIHTYNRWRKEYGGLKVEQAKHMKDLEKENTRLKRLVAELLLEKQVLKDVAEGSF